MEESYIKNNKILLKMLFELNKTYFPLKIDKFISNIYNYQPVDNRSKNESGDNIMLCR
jgi:hypothetical protein